MAAGVPCIASDVGDTALLVGDTGFIVPPGDAQTLADTLDKFLSLPLSERDSFGARGRRRVTENFEINNIIERYASFYDRIHENAIQRHAGS
jgi:glycosyltransferase involved in cell wall biosynthesis